MQKEIKYAFIASSKVIRFKVGRDAADILATLMYKYNYFKSVKRLEYYKGHWCFYLSQSDIIEETCIKKHTIKKSLSKLKNEGLIISKQQGLNLPNYYFIDEKLINKYIADYNEEYEEWRLVIRAENKSVTPINSLKELKQLSGKDSDNFQEGTQTTTTKNKLTKNKLTKNNFTNRINAADNKLDLMMYSDKLEKLIDDVKEAKDDEEKFDCNMVLFDFLCEIILPLKGFNISEQDFRLIDELGAYSHCKSYQIADKILVNAEAILVGSKSIRFGNLFVGLREINNNCELRYR